MDNVVYSEDIGFLKDSVRAICIEIIFISTVMFNLLKQQKQRTEIIGSVLTKDFTIL